MGIMKHLSQELEQLESEGYREEVGLFYKNQFGSIFTWQLVNDCGVTVALVDIFDGVVERVGFIPKLGDRRPTLVQLAILAYHAETKNALV